MKKYRIAAAVLLLLFPLRSLSAQDGFGFGFDSDAEGDVESPALPLGIKIGGEISVGFLAFTAGFESAEKAKKTTLGDISAVKLNFNASAFNADAFINLKLSADMSNPVSIDEAYLRAFFGPVSLEAGLRKLAWGKADSPGPLDVTNPLDYSDLSNVTDLMGRKIARPMIHASLAAGNFSKLEAVFVPAFQGHLFDLSGRWYPTAIIDDRAHAMIGGIVEAAYTVSPFLGAWIAAQIESNPPSFGEPGNFIRPTEGLEYAQGGIRFTTTIGAADVGAQYYSGILFRPSFSLIGMDDFLTTAAANPLNFFAIIAAANGIRPQMLYNRYHQIGVDYAQVLFGFNVRAEFAVNITGDLAGDDGSVYNPHLAWSLGFDRDVYRGLTVNMQINETVRLMDDKVHSNPAFDTEADTSVSNTTLTMQVSKKFFQDKLELKVTNLWGIEARDFYLIPALTYTIGDVTAELSGGIFGGGEGGELGQYHKNNFIKAALTYSF
jgi:hypothetical protein